MFNGAIQNLREWLHENIKTKTGVICPCCGQIAKMYKRKISGAMVRVLAEFYRAGAGSFHHYSKAIQNNISNCGDYTVLRHFGFIEPKDKRDIYKNSAGFWRITPAGIRFLFKDLSVPKYILIYNNKPFGVAGDMVNVEDCVGLSFSYPEIMSGLDTPGSFEAIQTELFDGGE